GNIDIRAAETAQPTLRRAFLRPVEFSTLWIDGDPDAPPRLIAPVLIAAAGLDHRFDLRSVAVRAHHAHALAVAPIKIAACFLEMELLRRMRDALRDDHPAMLTI